MLNGLGYEEGEVCGREGCTGNVELESGEGCYCHISPPCGSCTDRKMKCSECDWTERDDPLVVNDPQVLYIGPTLADVYAEPRRRVLDDTKISYRILPHSNSSQRVEGVFPPGTTREEVKKRVDGTFGGRFEKFDEVNRTFVFIAQTD
jgi:hypothetical protein